MSVFLRGRFNMRTIEEISTAITETIKEAYQQGIEDSKNGCIAFEDGIEEYADELISGLFDERYEAICQAEREKQSAEYVVEAIGSEAKHILDLLKAESEQRLVVLPVSNMPYDIRFLIGRITKLEAERDAAVNDLADNCSCSSCFYENTCENSNSQGCCNENWEWRYTEVTP